MCMRECEFICVYVKQKMQQASNVMEDPIPIIPIKNHKQIEKLRCAFSPEKRNELNANEKIIIK